MLKGIENLAGGRRISRWFVGLSLVFIAYFTLFPFDFSFGDAPSLGEVVRNFDLNITRRYAVADFPRNLILFVPLGFGLAGMAAEKWGQKLWAHTLVVLAGVGLSLAVETLQTYTLQRFPALGDVMANGSGTAVGVLLFLIIGNQIFRVIGRAAEFLKGFLNLRRALIAYLFYAGLLFFLSFLIQFETKLSNWDEGYFLIMGNEATGDRQWSGTIRQFYLLDRALSEDEVARLFEAGLAIEEDGLEVVGYYDFSGDGAANFPAVEWQGASTGSASTSSATASTSSVGVVFEDGRWLRSETAVTGISQALGEASAFTAVLVAKTDSLSQEGPARLVSISEDPFFRNLTIGQEAQELVLRVRTPLTGLNGRLPEFVFPDVFDDEDFKKIVVTYNGVQVGLFVNGTADPTIANLLPSTAILTNYFPDDVDRLRVNEVNIFAFQLIYSTLVYLPFSRLLEAWSRSFIGKNRLVWVVIMALVSGILWELLLGIAISRYQWSLEQIGINAGIILAGLLLWKK